MIWIHGGSFYWSNGNAGENGPEFFMDKEVIIVTVNIDSVFRFENLFYYKSISDL